MADGEEVVAQETEPTETAVETVDPLKQELSDLKQAFARLSAQLTPKEEKKVAAAMSPEVAKAIKDNPEMLMQFVQQQVDGAKKEFQGTVQRTDWDRRAETEFPALKTDKGFQQSVQKHAADLMAGGEFNKDSPRLIYMASKLAAAEYKPQKVVNKGDGEPSGLAPTGHSGAAGKNRIADTDPRVQIALAAGFSGERLEKFKATLGPRVQPVRTARRIG